MKVGILGSGTVGQTLGAGFAALGHDVMMGTREPDSDKVKAWVKQTGVRASAGTFAGAAAFGECAVLATLWSGTANAIRLAGPERLAGKVVMDATNPLVFRPDGPPALALGHTDSGGEQVQRWLPGARVVKVYNTVGSGLMVNPNLPGGPPDMFICGNDPAAKAQVSAICKAFGWPTIDAGGIEAARLLEPLCILWVGYGASTGTWNHAFKLLRK
jgi:8-hydroxy-5-deazaflavin:NADPH oxidoreductase